MDAETKKRMLIYSLKNNFTNPYSNMNAEGKAELKKAGQRSCVEYLHDGAWIPKLAHDTRYNDAVVYRIKNEFN